VLDYVSENCVSEGSVGHVLCSIGHRYCSMWSVVTCADRAALVMCGKVRQQVIHPGPSWGVHPACDMQWPCRWLAVVPVGQVPWTDEYNGHTEHRYR
jgi:hypothetical protein